MNSMIVVLLTTLSLFGHVINFDIENVIDLAINHKSSTILAYPSIRNEEILKGNDVGKYGQLQWYSIGHPTLISRNSSFSIANVVGGWLRSPRARSASASANIAPRFTMTSASARVLVWVQAWLHRPSVPACNSLQQRHSGQRANRSRIMTALMCRLRDHRKISTQLQRFSLPRPRSA